MDVVLWVVFVGSISLAAKIAERRGRSLRTWAGIAAIIGPLALPIIFFLPALPHENGNHA